LNKKINGKIENYVNKSNVGVIMVMDENQTYENKNIELEKSFELTR
jgi:hypothetical protein